MGTDSGTTDGESCGIHFDGTALRCSRGQPLIDALQAHGIKLPHLCYTKAGGPIQTCDTCWVEVGGELKRACTLKVADGLEVKSVGRATSARAEGMNRVLAKHELYCAVCDNNGDCELHNTFVSMNLPAQRYPFTPKPYAKDTTNPFYSYDPDQCILCGRCVEACQNGAVNEVLGIDWSAEHPRVLWDGGKPIEDSSCVSCGACVSACPCNALMEKSMDGEGGPFTGMPQKLKRTLIDASKALEDTVGMRSITAVSEIDRTLRQAEIKRTKIVCNYCAVGCTYEMWTRGRKVLKMQPSVEAPANGMLSCVKGKFMWDFVNSGERLTKPLIRDHGRFREASWDEALGLIARRLTEIRTQHGPDSIGFIASSKATDEESYLTQKMARLVVGTNNVDNCSRYCQSPATMGLFRTVGYGGDSGRIRDIVHADCVVIVGNNTAESHPVIASQIKQSHKHRGQKLIVIDPRRHEMARRADIHLPLVPGSDTAILSAFARYMFDHGHADQAFLDARVNGVTAYRESLEPFTLEFASQVSGLPVDQLVAAAEMIGSAKSVCILFAMGITQHSHGSDGATAISNLLLVTGNYGREGTGAYPMRGHNNVQGASDFGSMCNIYCGYESVTDEAVRARWAQGWGVAPEQLSNRVGLNNIQMIDGLGTGSVKALYIIGEETLISDSNANATAECLEKAEFLVVEDVFLSKTARFADVVLPACVSVEKDGTYVNTERRIQRSYKAMEPLGESRADWQILTDLARRMGHDWGYTHPSQIMDEIASISLMFKGVSYARLEGWKSLHWPMSADGSTDTPLLYTENFNMPEGKALLYPVQWNTPAEAADGEYDLYVNNGRLLEYFQGTNQTRRSAESGEAEFIEVSPELAQARHIEDGTWLRVTSRRGVVKMRAVVTDRVSGNQLYMSIHPPQAEDNVNLLTGDHRDVDVYTPAYKETAVRIEVLSGTGRKPRRKNNFRYGTPTPLPDVNVAAKWKRADYAPITEQAPHPERI
ncbi:MAG: formate dehydrogenase subunit alpha [Nevskiaceae bacterium]|nr:MAG: formate dehydrogenase subunit alpha [Nevskiaceae bacterium]TBR73373.1 MAG: formate dehydrogenase subunit alpha [Nevskiaceae bacterium]